jgi:hypothetical protein
MSNAPLRKVVELPGRFNANRNETRRQRVEQLNRRAARRDSRGQSGDKFRQKAARIDARDAWWWPVLDELAIVGTVCALIFAFTLMGTGDLARALGYATLAAPFVPIFHLGLLVFMSLPWWLQVSMVIVW